LFFSLSKLFIPLGFVCKFEGEGGGRLEKKEMNKWKK